MVTGGHAKQNLTNDMGGKFSVLSLLLSTTAPLFPGPSNIPLRLQERFLSQWLVPGVMKETRR